MGITDFFGYAHAFFVCISQLQALIEGRFEDGR
uniref:Uncharacterized protein n=1 Tax=Myoviridae sp. ctoIO8 TaxID=2825173 RepID=A0A8S5P1A9_9CAUD|nr:MAG TPA: hypothetical protein [Myoviridae sp. ctoIO8]